MKRIVLLLTIFFSALFFCSEDVNSGFQNNRLPPDYRLFSMLDDYPALRSAFSTVDEWKFNDLLKDALSDNIEELKLVMEDTNELLTEHETDMLVSIRSILYRILNQDALDRDPVVPYDDYSGDYASDFFGFYDRIADAIDSETNERLNLTRPTLAIQRKLMQYIMDKYPGDELEDIISDIMDTLTEKEGTTVSSVMDLMNRTQAKLLTQANDNMWLDNNGDLITDRGEILSEGKTNTGLGNSARGMEALVSGLNELIQDETVRDKLYDILRAAGNLSANEGFKDAVKAFICNAEDYLTAGGRVYDDPKLGKYYHRDDEKEYVNAELGNNLLELMPVLSTLFLKGGRPGSILNTENYPLDLFARGLNTMDLDIEGMDVEESIYRCIRYDDRFRDRLGSSDNPSDANYACEMNAFEKLLWFLGFANHLGFKPGGTADAEYIDPDVPCDDAFEMTHNRGHGESAGGIMTVNDFLYSVGSATMAELIPAVTPSTLDLMNLDFLAPIAEYLQQFDFFNQLTLTIANAILNGKELNVFGMCFDIALGHQIHRLSALQPGGKGDDYAGRFSVPEAYINWPGDKGLEAGSDEWEAMIRDPLNAKSPYYCSTPSYAFGGAGGYGIVGDIGAPWGGRYFRSDEAGFKSPWNNPDHNGDGKPDNQGMFISYCKDGLATVDTVPWMMGFMARACWSGEGPYYYAPEKNGKAPVIDSQGRHVYYCPNGEVYARVDKNGSSWNNNCDKYYECDYKHVWNSDFFILSSEDLDGVMRYYTYDDSVFHNGSTKKSAGLGHSICDSDGNPVYDTDYDIECDPSDPVTGAQCNEDYYLFTYDPDCNPGDPDCNPTLDVSQCGDSPEVGRVGYTEYLDCLYENNPHYNPLNKRPPKKPEDIVAGAVPCREFIPGVINSGTPNERTVTNADRECASQEEAMFKNFKWVLYEKHFMMPMPLPIKFSAADLVEIASNSWIVMECNGILALMKARKSLATWVDENDHSKGFNKDGNARWLIDKGWGYSDKPGDFRIVTMALGTQIRIVVPSPFDTIFRYLLGQDYIPLPDIMDSGMLYNNVVGYGSLMCDVMSMNGKVLESMLFMDQEAIKSILDLPSSTYGPDSKFWNDRNSLCPLMMVLFGILHDDAKKNPAVNDPSRINEYPFKVKCFDFASRGALPLLAKPLVYYQKKGGGTPYNTWKPRLKPPYEGYASNSWDYLRPGPSLDMRWWNNAVPDDEKYAWVDAPMTTEAATDDKGNEYPSGFFPYGGAQIFFEPLGLRTLFGLLAESEPKKCDGLLSYINKEKIITKFLLVLKELGKSKFDDPEGASDYDYRTWGARRKIFYGLEQMVSTEKAFKGEMLVERPELGGENYVGLDLSGNKLTFADYGMRPEDVLLDDLIYEFIGSDATGKGLAVYPDKREPGHPNYVEGKDWKDFDRGFDAAAALLSSKSADGDKYNVMENVIELIEKVLAEVKADDNDIRGLRHTMGAVLTAYNEESEEWEYPGEQEHIINDLLPEIYDAFKGDSAALITLSNAMIKEDGLLDYFIYALDSQYPGREVFEDLYAFLGIDLITRPDSSLWSDIAELSESFAEILEANSTRGWMNDEQNEDIIGSSNPYEAFGVLLAW